MPTAIELRVGGARQAVTEEEATEIRDRFRREIDAGDVVVRKVDVSCKQWSEATVEILRPIFQEVAPGLFILDLADTIAGLQTEIGLAVMAKWAQCFEQAREVKEMDFSDNAMGPRALERIAPLLGAPKLKKLRLNNCGLSAETIPQLNEALMVDGAGAARLTELELNKNMIGVEGAQKIGELLPACSNLVRFTYCGCRPVSGGTKFIASGLKKMVESNHSLQELELEDCTFGSGEEDDDAIHALGQALEKLPNLTRLNLRDGGDFGETGAGILSQALINAGCKTVYLDLSGCGLGPDGAQALQEFLQATKDVLKVLKLDTDELANDGLASILTAFEGSSNALTHLHVDENEFDEGAIDVLVKNGNFPNLKLLSLKDNMDLEEADDDKKQSLRDKFSGAKVCFDDEDEQEDAGEEEDAAVDELALQMAALET